MVLLDLQWCSEHDEGQFELIASSGGVKVSTISNDRNMDDKLVEMMIIARSVEVTVLKDSF